MAKAIKNVELNSKYNRQFSVEFKKQKAKAIATGKLSVKDLCLLYEISRTTVYKWLYLYTQIEKGTKTVLQMDSEEQKTKELLAQIAELERVVGRKQLEIDYLSKLIEISGEDLGMDLKKKAEQILSNGSGKR